MLARPLHVHHKTTHCHHHYRRHANLFKEGRAKTVASGCAQLWVADMTYLPTKEKAACLVVTDACSRKIVGWHVMECLLQRPADLPLARTMVGESVRLYNERRPHLSLKCKNARCSTSGVFGQPAWAEDQSWTGVNR